MTDRSVSTPSLNLNNQNPNMTKTSTEIVQGSATLTTSTSTPNLCCINNSKVQLLKKRKLELERKLNERNNELQQLIKKESEIINLTDQKDNPSTLRRKIGTSFKLPENLVNGKVDDSLNKLLLEKQLQLKISEASLKLSSDNCQTKSIRRTHKQSYESAQQKLIAINQNLNVLKKLQQNNNQSSDDVSVISSQTKYSTTSSTGSNNNLDTKSLKFNPGSNGNLSNNNHSLLIERRNSMNGLKQMPQRVRHDSYNNDYSSQSGGKISPSLAYPNSQAYSRQPQYYAGHNHLTNEQFNKSANVKKSAILDSDYNVLRTNYQPYEIKQQQVPYMAAGDIITTTNGKMVRQYTEDDVNEQYTYNKYYQQSPYPYGRPGSSGCSVPTGSADFYQGKENQNTSPHKSSPINRGRSPQLVNRSPQHQQQQPQQGLGGYWVTTENNERIWCTVDAKYSSLDRQNPQQKIKTHRSKSPQPTKSTSLSNFDVSTIIRQEDGLDAISISSMNSECKKLREKTWCETSLDSPIMKYKGSANSLHQSSGYSPQLPRNHQIIQSPKSPILYQRGEKLSSHSMSMPHRNNPIVSTEEICYQEPFYYEPTETIQSPSHYLPPNYPSKPSLRHTQSSVSSLSSPQHSNVYLHQKPPHHPPPAPQTHYPQHSHHQQQQNHSQYLLQQLQQKQQVSSSLSPNSVSKTNDIRIESPKNMTVVQQAKFLPYKEEEKPFEMSDFYKYSTKFRQKNVLPSNECNDDGNGSLVTPIQKVVYQPPNPSICHPVNYQ